MVPHQGPQAPRRSLEDGIQARLRLAAGAQQAVEVVPLRFPTVRGRGAGAGQKAGCQS